MLVQHCHKETRMPLQAKHRRRKTRPNHRLMSPRPLFTCTSSYEIFPNASIVLETDLKETWYRHNHVDNVYNSNVIYYLLFTLFMYIYFIYIYFLILFLFVKCYLHAFRYCILGSLGILYTFTFMYVCKASESNFN